MEEHAFHPGAERPGCLTILRSLDRRKPLTKAYTIAPNGLVKKTSAPNVAMFSTEVVEVAGIHDLHRLLCNLDGEPGAAVIRGAPLLGANLEQTIRRSKPNKNTLATIGNTPRAWLMLDLDGVLLPATMSVITDPADVAAFLVDMVAGHAPELEGVTAVVQFSSSAGLAEQAEIEAATGQPDRWAGVVKPGNRIGAHVWFWLTEPRDDDGLKRWGARINAEAGGKVIDTALFQSVQLHFTAAPLFGQGLHDPLQGRRVVLVEGSEDAAAITIPAKPERGTNTPGESRFAGIGYTGRLEAIGTPAAGFHEPINAAISAFIAGNWPNPDTDALLAALQRVIEAADPGGRAEVEIEKYANTDNLRARIQWVVDREEMKQATRRAEAKAADAVDPTFPSKAVTLGEGHRLAAAAVDRFTEGLRRGETPETLLQVTVGAGKSEAAVRAAGAILKAPHEGGREGSLYYLVPRHDLGDEIAERLRSANPEHSVATWRGMKAADPARPGKEMCLDVELIEAAQNAGMEATTPCPACPLRNECSYQRQKEQTADIWVGAHNLAFQAKPGGLPQAAALVIDEGFGSVALVGADNPVQLALSALRDDRTGCVGGLDGQRLRLLRNMAADALERHEPGGLMRVALIAAGFTTDNAHEWHGLEWRTKPAIKFVERPWTREAILEEIGKAAESGFLHRRAVLARFVKALLAGSDARSVNATFDPAADLGRGQGSGPAVRMAWRDDFAQWAAEPAKLLLDATTPPEVIRAWLPNLSVESIEVEALGQTVIQVADKAFGRAMFTQNGNNIGKLVDLISVELAKAGAGEVLVIAQQAVEDLLRPAMVKRHGDIPARLHLAHHGALTGMDKWRGVARVLVVGRPAMNREAGERLAEIVRGGAIKTVQDGDSNFWPEARGGIRMSDGTGRLVDQPQHPDPLVEALRWSITEGAVLQAIGRARGVQRPEGVHVTLLAQLALPLTVQAVTTWAELLPDRIEVAIAEAAIHGRALPLAPADLATARPDLWPSGKAAERDTERSKTPQTLIKGSYKALGGLSHVIARYRKPGARCWSKALVPLLDGRVALEALIGQVVAFELVEPAQPQEAAHNPPQPSPLPERPVTPPHGEAAPSGRVFVMGEEPPFDPPGRPAPPPINSRASPHAATAPQARPALAGLSLRLDRARPPRMLADGFDGLRITAWRDRCAIAFAAHHARPVFPDAIAGRACGGGGA